MKLDYTDKSLYISQNKNMKFTEWVAENHYYLYNIEDGVYYWKNETDTLTTNQLHILWKLQ